MTTQTLPERLAYIEGYKMQTLPERLAAIQAAHGLNDDEAAQYLGVPIHTFRNWRTGRRTPAPVVLRLLDVLALVETFNPALHAQFIPAKG